MGTRWLLDDIPWERFEPTKVDPEILKTVRAACLVEHHSDDYVTYLCSVFHDDPEFQAEARAWGAEEVQHGRALRRWVEIADPDFDFEDRFARFKAGHVLPLKASESVRGSRARELIARCIVEVGTSSFYSAVRDATEEPLLKHICHRIAGDEYRHYSLFYRNLKRYRAVERPSLWQGLTTALGRLAESSDDEIAYAYFCGNGEPGPYRRRRHSVACTARSLRHYKREHVRRGIAMSLKAAGVRPRSRLGMALTRLGWWLFRAHSWRVLRAMVRAPEVESVAGESPDDLDRAEALNAWRTNGGEKTTIA